MTFGQGHLPVEFKGGRMAAGPGASDAHHRAPEKCERNPAPYVGHDLRIVALVQVAQLSCEALQEAVKIQVAQLSCEALQEAVK